MVPRFGRVVQRLQGELPTEFAHSAANIIVEAFLPINMNDRISVFGREHQEVVKTQMRAWHIEITMQLIRIQEILESSPGFRIRPRLTRSGA